eukprot:s123_g2.t1
MPELLPADMRKVLASLALPWRPTLASTFTCPSLEVKQDVLAVRLADPSRILELVSPQGKTMEEWYRELQHVFDETASSQAADEDRAHFLRR